MKNLNVDVAEEGGTVVFLHKIAEGSADRSYGIQVARLAGIPEELLERAEYKLDELEKNSVSLSPSSEQKDEGHRTLEYKLPLKDELPSKAADNVQMSLFDVTPDPIISRLRELDLMNITPSEAIRILEELKRKI